MEKREEKLMKHQSTLRFQGKKFVQELKKQVYSELCKLNEKWTDPLFPPNDSSLYSGRTDLAGNLNV